MASICKILRIGSRNVIGDPWMCWHWVAENLMAEKKVQRCFATPHCLPWLRMRKALPDRQWGNHSSKTVRLPTSAPSSSAASSSSSPRCVLSKRTLEPYLKLPRVLPRFFILPYSWAPNMVSVVSVHFFILVLWVYLFQSNIWVWDVLKDLLQYYFSLWILLQLVFSFSTMFSVFIQIDTTVCSC